MMEIQGKYTAAKVFAITCEEACVAQIYSMVNHPAFTNPIAIMPDCHAGKGSVIGFTMPLTEQVIANVVGVDIGCGMLGIKVRRPKMSLEDINKAIVKRVPFGTHVRDKALPIDPHDFVLIQGRMHQLHMNLAGKFKKKIPAPPEISEKWFEQKCEQIGMDYGRAGLSIGSLGGGNHFIEMGESSTHPDYVWVIIHSGSRQFGEKTCLYHQGIAIQQLEDYREGIYKAAIENICKVTAPRDTEAAIRKFKSEHAERIQIPKGLEPLTGAVAYYYLYDMVFAQAYAEMNRAVIGSEIMKILGYLPDKPSSARNPVAYTEPPLERLETVHNYISVDDLIIRKGAVSAKSGEKIIIPFNMRDGTWICLGRGEPSWNYSAPHGAGRIMSRSKAKETLDPTEAAQQMEGIYTSHIPIDEAPDAYKSASEIKSAIGPVASVIEDIRPLMNMKAS